jgi:pimeloyl-ACP methyl ester carboxylesterase
MTPAQITHPMPPVGRHYDVAGRQLYLHRWGTGRPVVVILPGAGMFGLGYFNIQSQVAEFATSVIYDRAGTGWSEAAPLPRSLADVVEELRGLLRAADLQGPYLFVAHSLGGLYARRFAQLYPGEVAGMLLLDPAHEDFEANQPEVARRAAEEWKKNPMPEITAEQLQGYRPVLEMMYAAWPEDVRASLIERHLDITRYKTGLLEVSNVDALSDEIRSGGATPAVPVIVYTAMGMDPTQAAFATEDVIQAQNQAKLTTAEAYVRTVPGAENRVLDDASHLMLHTMRTDAVMQGVRDLLSRCRSEVKSPI